MRSISDRQRDLYQDSLKKHGDSSQATHQNDRVTQHLRFERLLRGLSPHLEGSSVHDVGCGFGELGRYMADHGAAGNYSGIEIVEGMAELGRKRLGVEIVVDDFMTRDYDTQYDFVVASGVFNIPGGTAAAEWNVYCRAMIKKMYSIARKGIAFNGLTTHTDYRRDDLHYWDPEEALSVCRSDLSRFCVLDQAYPLYEWTITAYRPELVRKAYSQDALDKYF